tara:strand:- start:340 stop:1371 length:1032 start_codon:yes stop_codon:yes gene_type:complete
MSTNSKQPDKRIFSGIQPTGNLHIGNYLGAIKSWVSLQNDSEAFFSIVDLHAITVSSNFDSLQNSIYEVTAAIIASGIDPKKSIVFNQSSVKEHTELCWIFSCIAKMGWLSRMTQFKEKAGKKRDNASIGLFSYPVLMAADILLYRATHVPVGDDQQQHLELTRDIANSFNHQFQKNMDADFFQLPEAIITGTAKRVMSLRDGTKKMSKSDISDASRINLTDSKDNIVKKIQKAKTDSLPLPENETDLENRPEAKNLIHILAGMTDKSPEQTLLEYHGKGFVDLKKNLTEVLIEEISPISNEMNKLLKDKKEIKNILIEGSSRARSIAKNVMIDVKEIINLKI